MRYRGKTLSKTLRRALIESTSKIGVLKKIESRLCSAMHVHNLESGPLKLIDQCLSILNRMNGIPRMRVRFKEIQHIMGGLTHSDTV